MQKQFRIKKAIRFNPSWCYLLFIIWPIVGMLFSAINFKHKSSRITLILFSILFGLTLVVYSQGIDSYTYAESFKEISKLPFSNVWQIFSRSYINDTGELDFFLPILFFIVSRFTDNGQVLFAVFALILSSILIANLKMLYQSYSLNKNKNSILFILFFVSIVPITNINHFRWYTALLAFTLGCQHILLKENKKYILLALSAAAIHFSFVIPLVILVIHLFLGNRFLLYYLILISSFLLADLTLPYLQTFIEGFSKGIQERVGSYTADNYVDEVKNKTGQRLWILLYSTSIAKYYLLAVMIYLKHFTVLFTKKVDNLYAFSILIFSLANFGRDIESVGSRFSVAFLVLACIVLVNVFVRSRYKKVGFLSLLGIVPYLMVTIVNIRMSAEITNVNLFFPFVFTPLLSGIDLSVFQVFQ